MIQNMHPKTYLEQNPSDPKNFGWIDAPHEVEKIVAQLPKPMIGDAGVPEGDEQTEVLTYTYFKQVTGRNEYPGPQLIGDCVGHGWKRGVDYTAVVQIYMQLKSEFGPTMQMDNKDVQERKSTLLEEFEEASCEAIYGLSRVEVGGQRGSTSDGSVGAWAAKAVTDFGTISWQELANRGLGGTYDSKRAKSWGANGLPTNLEDFARQHTIKNVSKVTTFADAAKLCQSGYVIPVCSNRGFTMTRDNQGFCSASGTWNHCMMFSSIRWDRPGLLCHQNWGLNTPTGPVYKEQPSNTFWVDAKVVDSMLGQGDSFCPSAFNGYPAQNLLTWAH
jgi:hypothetical protein